jgi:phosphoserine aminotransferase
MITFNPGPSQISHETMQDIRELSESLYLSLSHRSATFSEVSGQAIEGMHKKMGIPSEYKIFYQPSATSAMDTLLRNLVSKKSFHFVHGSFSSLFHRNALSIGLDALQHKTNLHEAVDFENAVIPSDIELIAITHNETSTGLMWPIEALRKIRTLYPDPLLAIDVTSSFGSRLMNWKEADIWFGSVQKCLGLPAGLGYLILGPRALEKAKQARGISEWQSILAMSEKMHTYQTPETPNMLNIALLARQMARWNIKEIENTQKQKTEKLYNAPLKWIPFVKSKEWQSDTVLCFEVDDPKIWHEKAKKGNMILGQGYGPLVNSTLRIANFPSISLENVDKLIHLLSKI